MTYLNLGSGDQYVPGWVNVDLPSCPHRADQHVDLAGRLPWADASIGRVYAGHLLEHMHWAQCRHLLLALRRCMRPGGQILVVGPDLAKAREMADAGEVLEVPLEHIKDGSRRWPGDEHRWAPDATSTGRLLELAGWSQIRPLEMAEVDGVWPVAFRGPRWQYAVTAVAPEKELGS